MSTTGPGQSTDLLMDVVAVLSAAKIEYAVIGAVAASVHGVVRASQDADAVIRATVRELAAVNNQLASKGFSTDLRYGDADDPIPALLLVTDEFGNRVDLLAGLKGMGVGIYARAVELKIPGAATLRVASREDLIAMKAFAGGPQDLLDARRCIAVAGAELDIPLLRRIVAGYGQEAITNCEKLLGETNIGKT